MLPRLGTPHRDIKTLCGGSNLVLRQRNDIDGLAKGDPRDIDQMLVVSEEQDLGLLPQLGQDLESRRRAGVVEIDQEVIGNKGERMCPADIFIDRGQTESEIELIRGAVAHAADAD